MTPLRLVQFSLIALLFPLPPYQFLLRRFDPPTTITSSQPSPRVVRIAPSHGVVGGTMVVSVELISQGDENAVSFTLNYNPALLTSPQVELGGGATGSLLTVNPNQAAQGRIGIVLSLPAGQQFSTGTRPIVAVVFSIPANAVVGATPVGFGDQPVRREVVDANARSLPGNFTSGQVIITPEGYEADVSPRPGGDNDGNVTLADFVQVGRFVAGLDAPEMIGEFQRADCAPLNTLGDGRLTVTDWAQAGRYVAGLDAAQRASGPAEPLATAFHMNPGNRHSGEDIRHPMQTRQDSLVHLVMDDPGESQAANKSSGLQQNVAVMLSARGDEHALSFSLSFNPARWRFVSASTGAGATEARLLVNARQAAQGQVGLAMMMPVGLDFGDGERQLILLNFAALAGNAPLAVSFGDLPVTCEAANIEARPIPALFIPNAGAPAIAAQSFPSRAALPVHFHSAYSGERIENPFNIR